MFTYCFSYSKGWFFSSANKQTKLRNIARLVLGVIQILRNQYFGNPPFQLFLSPLAQHARYRLMRLIIALEQIAPDEITDWVKILKGNFGKAHQLSSQMCLETLEFLAFRKFKSDPYLYSLKLVCNSDTN